LPPTPNTAKTTDRTEVDTVGCASVSDVQTDVPRASPNDGATANTDIELFPGFSLSPEDVETCFRLYGEELVLNYPFVPFDSEMSAYQLYSDERLLFWTVMSVTAPQSSWVQQSFKRWFRSWIAEHMIKGQEKRLEILQAILLHLGW
jgi:hypothetical protein